MNKKHILTLCGIVAVAIFCALWFTQSASTPTPSSDKQAANAQSIASSVRETSAPALARSGSQQPLLASEGGTLKTYEAEPAHAIATLKVGPQSFTPRQFGNHFERVAVKAKQAIPVELSWPGDSVGTEVLAQAIDGGKIDGEGSTKTFSLAENRTINFVFTPDSSSGIYEVVLRRGMTEEALVFWVPTTHPEYDPPTLQ